MRVEIEPKVEDQCWKSQENVKIMIISKGNFTLPLKDKIFFIVKNAQQSSKIKGFPSKKHHNRAKEVLEINSIKIIRNTSS